MNLHFNIDLSSKYKSPTQSIRCMSEDWVGRNLFCPICGNPRISHYPNNTPVGDFFCEHCRSDFELKSKESKSGSLGKTIPDGAYHTMIERIKSFNNPNFLFLTYNDLTVNNILLVPNYFFVPDIIIKRPPLPDSARRAGWEGCNISIENIPETGKIYIIKNSELIDKSVVVNKYNQLKGLHKNNMEGRGWLMDTLKIVEQMPNDDFTLQEMYEHEMDLRKIHQDNFHIKAKIRQQLQFLRDKGMIEFLERGRYRRLF